MGVKALLAQSPAISPWVPRRQWEPPSVALATIAAQTDRHDVRVADMVVWRRQAPARFLETLKQFRPRVVGFSAMTFQYETALRFAALAKRFDEGILTVLGGYHATLFSEEIAAGPDARYWDFLVRGEGDFAFGELLDCVESSGSGLEGVLGLSWKRNGGFVHNPARPLADLSRLRIPARDKRLARGFHMYFRRADAIETSRGCLHQCNFCSIREMYGRSFRRVPDRPGPQPTSRTPTRAAPATSSAPTTTSRSTWTASRRSSTASSGSGCATSSSPPRPARSASPGAPGSPRRWSVPGSCRSSSASRTSRPRASARWRSRTPIESIRRGVAELQSEDITVIAGLINGMPQDDAESIRENYEFVRDLGITSVMDQLLTPYPKTELRKEMLAAGLVANHDDFRWYDGYFANVRTRAPVAGAARLRALEDAPRRDRDVAPDAGRLEVLQGLHATCGSSACAT